MRLEAIEVSDDEWKPFIQICIVKIRMRTVFLFWTVKINYVRKNFLNLLKLLLKYEWISFAGC